MPYMWMSGTKSFLPSIVGASTGPFHMISRTEVGTFSHLVPTDLSLLSHFDGNEFVGDKKKTKEIQ